MYEAVQQCSAHSWSICHTPRLKKSNEKLFEDLATQMKGDQVPPELDVDNEV